MDNTKSFRKSLIYTSMLLALGAHTGLASAATHGVNNNNFTMLDPGGGGTGGTNLVEVIWDGTFNTDVNTAVVNMTISSEVPFFGVKWYAHDVQVYGPGTYVFEACPGPMDPVTFKSADGSFNCTIDGTPQTMTVGVGQVGAHMLFDWNGSVNIDVVNVWDVDAIWAYGPNDGNTPSRLQTGNSACIGVGKGADLGTPECVEFFATQWLYTALIVDPIGDLSGVPGAAMVDGPFKGFKANFNIQKQAIYDDAMIAWHNTSSNTPDVLANDQLPTTLEMGTFAISAFDAVTVEGGSITDNGDGTFAYMPALDYVGADSFTYTVDDTLSHFATATVNIDVIINPIPVLVDDSVATNNDAPVTTANVMANDSFPANGAVFTITGFDAVTANGGTVVDNSDGTLTYTPDAAYVGSDSFTYTVDDGNVLHTATATVNVQVYDPIPVLANDSIVTDMDVPVTTANVMTNDVFPLNGAVFTVTGFDAVTANGGTVVNNGDGTLTYTPAASYVGSDSFTYTVDDGNVLHFATATVNVEVNAIVVPAPVVTAAPASSSGSVFALPLMFLLLPLRLFSRKK